MRFTHQATMAAVAALGIALASGSVRAESSSAAAVVTGSNGSSSVSINTAPVGSTVVVNGKPCKVVAGDDTRHMSGTVTTTSPNGGSSVSIGTASGGGGVIMGSSSDGTSTCMVIKPKASADDDRR
jgi:hypothetical protein